LTSLDEKNVFALDGNSTHSLFAPFWGRGEGALLTRGSHELEEIDLPTPVSIPTPKNTLLLNEK
jgi:hypothetical protein